MDYMVDTPAPRPAWKRFLLAALFILAVAGCHFAAVLVCYYALGPCPFMGIDPSAAEVSEYRCWFGGLGLLVLSFPVGCLLCSAWFGNSDLFFPILAANSLFWGFVAYFRYQVVKHSST